MQVCTEVSVFGGQQGSLEYRRELHSPAIQQSQVISDQSREELTSRIFCLTGCDSTWANDIARRLGPDCTMELNSHGGTWNCGRLRRREMHFTLGILCIPDQCVAGSFYSLSSELSVAAVVSFF